MALTRRGLRVRAIVRFIFWLAVFWLAFWLIDIVTTPDECRVAVEDMSQFCLDLIYP
jgi:hypothetical protein